MIGGGIHGLATAYFLAKEQGMKNVAVIESRYVGFGGSGRNTAIVRANQRSQENVKLYDEGLKLWPRLMDELDFNMMFDNCGNLNTAHSEAAMSAARLAVFHCPVSAGCTASFWTAPSAPSWLPQLNMSRDITYSRLRRNVPPARRHPAPRRRGLGPGQGSRQARSLHLSSSPR